MGFIDKFVARFEKNPMDPVDEIIAMEKKFKTGNVTLLPKIMRARETLNEQQLLRLEFAEAAIKFIIKS